MGWEWETEINSTAYGFMIALSHLPSSRSVKSFRINLELDILSVMKDCFEQQ